MAEEELKFELDTVSDRNTGVLAVADYDNTLALAKRILEEHPVFEITNDDDKKVAKNLRASFNKIVKSIDRRRIDTVADFTTDFTEQCNNIKVLFDDAQKALGERINAYEEAQKTVAVEGAKVTKYTATLKFTDPKVVDKLTAFAQKYGCELTIK